MVLVGSLSFNLSSYLRFYLLECSKFFYRAETERVALSLRVKVVLSRLEYCFFIFLFLKEHFNIIWRRIAIG